MNNLIEKIDKIIGKKGSIKTPAYFIRGLLIDIVKYFGNNINSLIKDIKNIKKITTYTPTGVIYAGYSDRLIAIKDIYTDHYILSEDPNYCSFAVLYSTKKITKIAIRLGEDHNIDDGVYDESGNGLYVYRVGLEEVAKTLDDNFYGSYRMKVTYIDGDEEYIDTRLVIIDTGTVRGEIILNINGVSKKIYIFGNNLTEFSINVPNGTESIETSSEIRGHYKFIFLLNNHEIPTEYIKETENDKIICKLIRQ